MLTCDQKEGLRISYVGNGHGNDTGILRVDGGEPDTISWRAKNRPGVLEYNHGGFDHGQLLKDMASGRLLTLALGDRVDFPLDGARAAIDQVIAACKTREYARYQSFADLEAKLAQERERWARRDDFNLAHLHDQRMIGPALASGQQDAALAGIGRERCIAACLGRKDCLLSAYDDASGICSLHGDLGPMQARSGALTTLVERRPERTLSPMLPGPGLVEAKGLRWVPGEDWRGYVKRLRDASMPLGADCQAEANEMARFASGLQITPPPKTAVAGETVSFAWRSGRLAQRIPGWMVISADRPARFEGEGFYALNAGAIGPFGITQDADRPRAFAPVYAESGVDGGSVGIVPLEAGPNRIRVTLVSYLRRCQQELPLAQMVFDIAVAPAPPRIVLRDITEGHPYDKRITVPEFNRRIELNDTRFVIQNLTDGSEVLAREGKSLRLSPTKRYISVFDDSTFDIFDLIDGARVGRGKGQMLAYWNADSFFVTDESYWGQITFGNLIQKRTYFEEYRTSSACCFNRGKAGMNVDLENNFASLGAVIDLHDARAKSILSDTHIGSPTPNRLAPKSKTALGGSYEPHIGDAG